MTNSGFNSGFSTEYANVSLGRYTELIIELERKKQFELKFHRLAQNIVNNFIDNNGHNELYSWDRDRLLDWGFTVPEIEAMVSNYEDKTSRDANSKENE